MVENLNSYNYALHVAKTSEDAQVKEHILFALVKSIQKNDKQKSVEFLKIARDCVNRQKDPRRKISSLIHNLAYFERLFGNSRNASLALSEALHLLKNNSEEGWNYYYDLKLIALGYARNKNYKKTFELLKNLKRKGEKDNFLIDLAEIYIENHDEKRAYRLCEQRHPKDPEERLLSIIFGEYPEQAIWVSICRGHINIKEFEKALKIIKKRDFSPRSKADLLVQTAKGFKDSNEAKKAHQAATQAYRLIKKYPSEFTNEYDTYNYRDLARILIDLGDKNKFRELLKCLRKQKHGKETEDLLVYFYVMQGKVLKALRATHKLPIIKRNNNLMQIIHKLIDKGDYENAFRIIPKLKAAQRIDGKKEWDPKPRYAAYLLCKYAENHEFLPVAFKKRLDKIFFNSN